jgi:hypothetical protein
MQLASSLTPLKPIIGGCHLITPIVPKAASLRHMAALSVASGIIDLAYITKKSLDIVVYQGFICFSG